MQSMKLAGACSVVNVHVLQEGETAVHLAAELTPAHVHYELEDSDILRLLLEFGGDVNIPTKLVLMTGLTVSV